MALRNGVECLLMFSSMLSMWEHFKPCWKYLLEHLREGIWEHIGALVSTCENLSDHVSSMFLSVLEHFARFEEHVGAC